MSSSKLGKIPPCNSSNETGMRYGSIGAHAIADATNGLVAVALDLDEQEIYEGLTNPISLRGKDGILRLIDGEIIGRGLSYNEAANTATDLGMRLATTQEVKMFFLLTRAEGEVWTHSAKSPIFAGSMYSDGAGKFDYFSQGKDEGSEERGYLKVKEVLLS